MDPVEAIAPLVVSLAAGWALGTIAAVVITEVWLWLWHEK